MNALAVPEVDEPDALRAALKAHFGFDDFNKGQRTVIEDVLAGKPTIAVMPTGAGKSLCYQLPALLLDGVTVVVSPLIALMKDQVDALRARGIAAAFVNSSQSPDEQRAVIDQVASGELKLVYVAPERFRHNAFVRALQQARIALFAVDEAHCISRWGHDFRPDYTRLGAVLDRLEPPRILACTATATAEVRTDIVGTLHLAGPAVHVHGFLRPNLFLEARLVGGDRDREKRLAAFLRSEHAADGSIIIYASTRKRVERYAETVLKTLGAKAVVAYHGGMSDTDRKHAQDRFMKGEARVAVATNAFGMGVDRGDVRAVIHVDLPRTVEGYYQEVGRAGRDRQPAKCLLLYNPNDTRVHEFLIDQSHPSPGAISAVWDVLKRTPPEVVATRQLIERQVSSEHEGMVDAALRQLMRVDAVRADGYETWRAHPEAPIDAAQLGIDFEAIHRHREHELNKLQQMRRFVHHPGCRHAYVLQYFGEPMEIECPGCERCAGGGVGAVPGVEHAEPTEEEALLLRKALAGVARADGRFGMRKVAAMLAGSRSKSIEKTSLVRLTTFGVLRPLSADRSAELLQLLIDQRLCRLSTGRYPMITITDAGWEVMQGRTSAGFRPPAHLVPGAVAARRAELLRQGKAVVADGSADPDADALVVLRAFRTEQARNRGVPPYVVFNDRSMCALAAYKPTDEASFLALPGLGPSKWATYGPDIVALLADFRG